VLAITTDGLVEELETGLYDDPDLIGWMAVTVNASDLAAVGAEPLGIVIAETLPRDAPAGFLERMQQGISDACDAYHLPLLGGDTNHSSHLALTGTALGICLGPPPVTRRGARPGHHLFVSGPLGAGGAFAWCRLLAEGVAEPPFRPVARVAEGAVARRYASAMMDTSDGLIATLDELGRLNGVGFELAAPLSSVIVSSAETLVRQRGLPPWMLLAGPHGEFELVIVVPPERRTAFLIAAAAVDWRPIELGRVTAEPGLAVALDEGTARLDTRRVRDLWVESAGDARRYLEALTGIHGELTGALRR
jgi:thiamine-monophosphate kinase